MSTCLGDFRGFKEFKYAVVCNSTGKYGNTIIKKGQFMDFKHFCDVVDAKDIPVENVEVINNTVHLSI